MPIWFLTWVWDSPCDLTGLFSITGWFTSRPVCYCNVTALPYHTHLHNHFVGRQCSCPRQPLMVSHLLGIVFIHIATWDFIQTSLHLQLNLQCLQLLFLFCWPNFLFLCICCHFSPCAEVLPVMPSILQSLMKCCVSCLPFCRVWWWKYKSAFEFNTTVTFRNLDILMLCVMSIQLLWTCRGSRVCWVSCFCTYKV